MNTYIIMDNNGKSGERQGPSLSRRPYYSDLIYSQTENCVEIPWRKTSQLWAIYIAEGGEGVGGGKASQVSSYSTQKQPPICCNCLALSLGTGISGRLLYLDRNKLGLETRNIGIIN